MYELTEELQRYRQCSVFQYYSIPEYDFPEVCKIPMEIIGDKAEIGINGIQLLSDIYNKW